MLKQKSMSEFLATACKSMDVNPEAKVDYDAKPSESQPTGQKLGL